MNVLLFVTAFLAISLSTAGLVSTGDRDRLFLDTVKKLANANRQLTHPRRVPGKTGPFVRPVALEVHNIL